ncbi:MAG: leucyl aminopeptidase, partial [Bacteroidia bacterium]|nr:leucyl aminopeptidase [Bacteroidia bacterium]
KEILVRSKKAGATEISRMQYLTEAVVLARTLVNEPQSFLTSTRLGQEFVKMGKDAGFRVKVLKKQQIKALKMGGLLAVNQGSTEPPVFIIMEYRPRKVKNKKPYVLIGKGVVYDTGGLSLKPTANSMDFMKSDMAGAAAVGSAMYAIAKAKLPIHVVALVPSTDNRPGGNAYTPGDVVTMMSGKTVEVLNTDAEGRMLLADALHYAKRYDPELVMDFATLTGAAAAAVGPYGIVCMGTAGERVRKNLLRSGENVYERLAEFPFWEEYDELLKSDIADMKNIGGPVAGAITAGKFLQHFTGYPWMHFDIAGPSYLHANSSYRGKNGTGVGVRLLFDYFTNL